MVILTVIIRISKRPLFKVVVSHAGESTVCTHNYHSVILKHCRHCRHCGDCRYYFMKACRTYIANAGCIWPSRLHTQWLNGTSVFVFHCVLCSQLNKV